MKYVSRIIAGNGGIEGYNQITLTYDEGSQEIYAEQYSDRRSVAGQGLDVIWHEPTGSAPQPISITAQNKEIYLETAVLGATTNAVIASINALKRMIRRASDSADEKIRVKIEPDGSSYATYYNVLFGYVDDSAAYYKDGDTPAGQIAKDILVILTCEPYGYGDSFTLSNQLASSPHFVEDSNADGLADGWTKTGTPTTSINTTQYLMGGKSQAISTSTQFHGIYSSSISLDNGESGAGYVWLTVGTAGWVIQIYNVTDASVTVTKTITATDSNAVSDRSTKNSAGGTAWRVPLTWTNSTGGTKSYRIYIIAAASTSSNCIVHMAYLSEAASVPPAFSSKRSLYNRYDPTIATTNINYLDVWGVPGDAPALVNVLVEPSAGNLTKLIVGAFSDGKSKVTDILHYHDSSLFSDTDGTWTTGTGTIGNDYQQCSTTSGILSYGNAISNTYAREAWRVFVVGYTSNASATVQIKYNVAPDENTVAQTSVGQFTQTGTWQLLDLGILNLRGVLSEDIDFDFDEEIYITQASSQTVRIEGVYYMPISGGFNIAQHFDPGDIRKSFYYDGKDEQVYDYLTGTRYKSVGRPSSIQVGNKMTRIIFIALSITDDAFDLSAVFPVTLTVTPRTSHLLGVS